MRFTSFIFLTAIALTSGITGALHHAETNENQAIADDQNRLSKEHGSSFYHQRRTTSILTTPGPSRVNKNQRGGPKRPDKLSSAAGNTASKPRRPVKTPGRPGSQTAKTAPNARVNGGTSKAQTGGKAPSTCPVKRPKLRFSRRNTSQKGSDGKWHVDMGEVCLASSVAAGEVVSFEDLSGCSAVFFFHSNGMPTTAHITAGNEAREASAAANLAASQGTVQSAVIYHSHVETSKGKSITKVLEKAFPGAKVSIKTYSYDGAKAKRTLRIRISLVAGQKEVEIEEYHTNC